MGTEGASRQSDFQLPMQTPPDKTGNRTTPSYFGPPRDAAHRPHPARAALLGAFLGPPAGALMLGCGIDAILPLRCSQDIIGNGQGGLMMAGVGLPAAAAGLPLGMLVAYLAANLAARPPLWLDRWLLGDDGTYRLGPGWIYGIAAGIFALPFLVAGGILALRAAALHGC